MIYQVYLELLNRLKKDNNQAPDKAPDKAPHVSSLVSMFKDVEVEPQSVELTSEEKDKLANRGKTPKRPLKKNKSPKEIAKAVNDKVDQNTNTPIEALPDTEPRFKLFPEQKADVDKAMKRFEKGRGMLFTNGTGTGKTAVGAGIIKEFVDKKSDAKILVVTPSDTKNRDWIEEIEMFTNLKFKMLKGITDKGGQLSITTYSNFSKNIEILKNDYDLIVYDESHKLLANNTGKHSTLTKAHFANANHTNGRFQKYMVRELAGTEYQDLVKKLNKIDRKKKFGYLIKKPFEWGNKNTDFEVIKAIRDIEDRKTLITQEQIDKGLNKKELTDYAKTHHNGNIDDALFYLSYYKDFGDLSVETLRRARDIVLEIVRLEKKASDSYKKDSGFYDTKVVFLSATPYKGHFSLEYGDEFITDIGLGKNDDGIGLNIAGTRDNFYINNFGYSMKSNTLIQPSVETDVNALEVMFTEQIIKSGAMSGRTLKVSADYSRKFVEVDGGTSLSKFKYAMEDTSSYTNFQSFLFYRFFGYPQGEQINESLMCGWYIDRIKKHIAMGRKIVIFHKYQKGSPIPNVMDFSKAEKAYLSIDKSGKYVRRMTSILDDMKAFYQYKAWREKHTFDLDASKSVVEQILAEFGKSKVVTFNGSVPKNKRKENIDKFNKDPKVKIIIVQEQSGKEGISLHDRESNGGESVQRVVINFSKPTDPISAIQIEGRIYRLGVASNAIIEYPILNTKGEKWDFVNKINRRVGTVENLALGEKARGLSRAFKDGYLNATTDDPNNSDGLGGKENDFLLEDELTPYQKAKALYHTTTPKGRAKDKKDFFGTPDPLGFKMSEWANTYKGDRMLEPSAGAGSIGRYFPLGRNHSYIELDSDNRDRLLGVVNDSNDILEVRRFEELDTSNKFEAVVMNPPFGKNSVTAYEHLVKALKHLVDGGRVVAILPAGNSLLKKMKEIEDNPQYAIRMIIELPSVTFKRVGTSVYTRIYIIDKVPHRREYNGYHETLSLTKIKTIEELFDEIEELEVPTRLEPLSEDEVKAYLEAEQKKKDRLKRIDTLFEEKMVKEFNVSKSDAQTLRRLARGTSSVRYDFSKLGNKGIFDIGDLKSILLDISRENRD